MMLSLGDFQFSVETAAYTQFALRAEYPWATVERLQNTPQFQAMGKETRSVTLEGVVYPTYRDAGVSQVERLREAATKMEPQYLVSGDGRYLGRWIVKSISQTDTVFFEDGTPRKQEFSLEMERFDI
jgi:phage protein U